MAPLPRPHDQPYITVPTQRLWNGTHKGRRHVALSARQIDCKLDDVRHLDQPQAQFISMCGIEFRDPDDPPVSNCVGFKATQLLITTQL